MVLNSGECRGFILKTGMNSAVQKYLSEGFMLPRLLPSSLSELWPGSPQGISAKYNIVLLLKEAHSNFVNTFFLSCYVFVPLGYPTLSFS